MSDTLSPNPYAALQHIQRLRDGVIAGESLSRQLEAAVLLIDVYEAILERNGILIYEGQTEVKTQ